MMETGTADTIPYSGSFNPIHRGHLAVAEQVLQAFPGSELWLVVSPQNPLKSETDLAPEQHRLEMARIAVRHSLLHERMQVCDIEFSLPKPSATIHTLQALSARHPQRSFSLLIGSDNAACFNQWIAIRYWSIPAKAIRYSPGRQPISARFYKMFRCCRKRQPTSAA